MTQELRMMSTHDQQTGAKRIAAIATVFFPLSHADVILSRWNKAFATDAEWGWNPQGETRIVSLYVAQHPQDDLEGKNDISSEYAAQHGVVLTDTLEQALAPNGRELAVDGVLLIGEHGDYPANERGQKLYPRKELFDQIVAVFRKTGKCVPVFCDKHLSWNPDWAVEMVETAAAMGFPLMAGSTTPHCGTEPHVEVKEGEKVEQALGVYYGGEEVYGFHSLELLQSLLEKRAGGEPGVRTITAWRGKEIEEGLDPVSRELLVAALRVAKNPTMESEAPWKSDDRERFVLYRFDHYDGLVSRHLMLNGCVAEWIAAIKIEGESGIRAGRAKMGGADSFYGHFARLDCLLQEMFVTGESPVAVERTLLTTQMIARATEALMQTGVPLEVELATRKRKLLIS